MSRFAQSVLVAVTLATGAPELRAQQHTLGLNLSVLRTQQLGVTWLVSPSLAIRPSMIASWTKTRSPLGGEVETTQLGGELDFLFRAATWDRVTSYYGLGGLIAHVSSSAGDGTLWGAELLLGARVRVLDRVTVFGEVGLGYQQDERSFGIRRATFETLPLGVVVFLK